MRRLNSSGGVPKHDIVREMRALRRGLQDQSFPVGPYEGRGYYHWKLPTSHYLVSAPTARLPVQATCAQILLDTAKRLAQEKPQGLKHTRVYAIIDFPNMFQSEVCVFFDPDCIAELTACNSDDYRWTRKSGGSLVDRLGLSLPVGFEELGFDTYSRDDSVDPPFIEEGEIWLIGEFKG